MDDDDFHPIVRATIGLLALAVGGFTLWCTYLAFVGGTVPVFGWELAGSAGQGLLWLFVVTPIMTTIGYWLSILITLPLAAIFRNM